MIKINDIILKVGESKNVEVYLSEDLFQEYYEKFNISLDISENVMDAYNYFNDLFKTIWKDFTPREASSMSSDYYEYFDRVLQSNGYLKINSTTNKIVFERPLLEFDTLYVFNKRTAESFIYDFQDYYNIKYKEEKEDNNENKSR